MPASEPSQKRLDPAKFRDPKITATGEPRAKVALESLETLWINTGTLCNLTCRNCYIESSPRNDRYSYFCLADLRFYLDEIERDRLGTRLIGFTGGEPFMNPALPQMLEETLERGFNALVLTNAMKPMMKYREPLKRLKEHYGGRLVMRVSIDHYSRHYHELERGRRSWQPAIEGLCWLARNGFAVNVAGRMLSGETQAEVRDGFARLFRNLGISVDPHDPVALVLFPEMDATADVPEITVSCWGVLGKSPADVMCASSRMVVKRKDRSRPVVLSCTLLPYDERFELGHTLAEARGVVHLNHPHCAKFCVLGGASCSR